MRRATSVGTQNNDYEKISIHALLAESDAQLSGRNLLQYQFLSTLSLRRATRSPPKYSWQWKFLSTLSLRRATNGRTASTSRTWNFYPRSPCGERPYDADHVLDGGRISIHALLAESDTRPAPRPALILRFLSTLSLRRATLPGGDRPRHTGISIHALLAESDDCRRVINRALKYFYPRSPCGERLLADGMDAFTFPFLSTLSLRRATRTPQTPRTPRRNFYPRSPCGERPDGRPCKRNPSVFLSTLSLRRATPAPGRRQNDRAISIHALLAESDLDLADAVQQDGDFYPRSPCGERPSLPSSPSPPGHFYPRSPCGERRQRRADAKMTELFLSTLSLRRATWIWLTPCSRTEISIHALLAESDTKRLVGQRTAVADFYPRSPCGERPRQFPLTRQRSRYFYPRSPCGERPTLPVLFAKSIEFLSTLSLRRATAASVKTYHWIHISIHALLAESDYSLPALMQILCHFYPRSPCGERPHGSTS